MRFVAAEAPTRVDLAGGTLDLWPIHQQFDEIATVNVGITLPAKVVIEELQSGFFRLESVDQKVEVHGDWLQTIQDESLALVSACLKSVWDEDLPSLSVRTQAMSPAGAGLGGSSCLAVTLLAALHRLRFLTDGRREPSEEQLVQQAKNVEARLIKSPTGTQDYWGAVRGCLNVIEFPSEGEQVATSEVKFLEGLESQMIICFSGKSRSSAINNWEIFKGVFDGDVTLIKKLRAIGELAARCGEAAKVGDWESCLGFSAEEWELRRTLWPAIETAETKAIDQAAKDSGARFSRVCGAGGGGVMVVFADKKKRDAVKVALAGAGGQVLEAKIAGKGLEVSDGQR